MARNSAHTQTVCTSIDMVPGPVFHRPDLKEKLGPGNEARYELARPINLAAKIFFNNKRPKVMCKNGEECKDRTASLGQVAGFRENPRKSGTVGKSGRAR